MLLMAWTDAWRKSQVGSGMPLSFFWLTLDIMDLLLARELRCGGEDS